MDLWHAVSGTLVDGDDGPVLKTPLAFGASGGETRGRSDDCSIGHSRFPGLLGYTGRTHATVESAFKAWFG